MASLLVVLLRTTTGQKKEEREEVVYFLGRKKWVILVPSSYFNVFHFWRKFFYLDKFHDHIVIVGKSKENKWNSFVGVCDTRQFKQYRPLWLVFKTCWNEARSTVRK